MQNRVLPTLALALFSMSCCCAENSQKTAGTQTSRLTTLPSTSVASSNPAEPEVFFHQPTGVRLSIPRGYKRVPCADYVLCLRSATADSPVRLSLDIPTLPPHVPGWIPLGLVRNGYVDDLRERHADLKAEDVPPPTIAGASCRLVRSVWVTDGMKQIDWGLLIVRKDAVYVLHGVGPESAEGPIRLAVDEIAKSLDWPVQPPAR